MIYRSVDASDAIDQGDIFQACPVPVTAYWDLDMSPPLKVEVEQRRVIVLNQACDLANEKTSWIVVSSAYEAQSVVDRGLLKSTDIKGPVRSLRVFGWYFLPKSDEHQLPEMIVDLRQLHTVRLDMLRALCLRGQRKARLQPLYREHLNQHFANSYARIGLPQSYPTD